ncbi:MAG: serine/threonine-protein kinase PknD [Chlamydiales bacterium]|nr:serine/threonine-protein kinase PknD [Chlamydiales bacterium]
MTNDSSIQCPFCNATFKRSKERQEAKPLVFCAYCGNRLLLESSRDQASTMPSSMSLVDIPKPEEIQSVIGQYQVVNSIGKGGMGEVFLAYDTVCGRMIAIKRIREDLAKFPLLKMRFLREARITAQLTHPSIIPIYSIGCVDNLIYYSMPYVEGETLKMFIRRAKEKEKRLQRKPDPHSSIPFLVRQFLQVCQAVAYAHSKGVLHRDLKPENIIIGKYGQVLILDWGLAKVLGDEEELPIRNERTDDELDVRAGLTRIGKVVGTVSFMAPERAQGKPATIKTDIYSLGVMLYQLLTLQLPFRRKSLREFKKRYSKEQLVSPEIMAPYRDVPEMLSETVKRCLAADDTERYASVDELIESLENYLEGKSEWVQVKELDIDRKDDWQFQENVLLTEHLALTRATETSEWVSLMISKDGFSGNMKLEARLRFGVKGQGIGILFSVPESMDIRHLTDGYCLWLGSEHHNIKTTRLLLSSVSVHEAPQIVLANDEWHTVRVEKVDDQVSFYLDDILRFSYVSHIPVIGNHVGLLSRDADFEIEGLTVSVGSQNINVNCLAVPDAFLATKMYAKALAEYRRIGASFIGRQEGREALFRAGMTLLEQAKDVKFAAQRKELLDLALDEFTHLRNTPGSPLEYLGKSFVYHELEDYEEEAKCFELALRRYSHHPLVPILEEQIVFRMHESSHQNRLAAYHFICLVTRFLAVWAEGPVPSKLFASLEKNWEKPFFIQHSDDGKDAELKRISINLCVSFWLAKPYIISEILDDILQRPIVAMPYLADAIFLLVMLGSDTMAKEKMARIRQVLSLSEQERYHHALELSDTIIATASDLKQGVLYLQTLNQQKLSLDEERFIWFLLRSALDQGDEEALDRIVQRLLKINFQFENQEIIDALIVEKLIYEGNVEGVQQVLQKYPALRLAQESSPLYFVNSCYLVMREGIQAAMLEFNKLLDIAFPRSWVLGAHFVAGKIHMTPAGWFMRSFAWERRCLYQQLRLVWHAAKDIEKAQYWKGLIEEETL